jgi:hypothetical protein
MGGQQGLRVETEHLNSAYGIHTLFSTPPKKRVFLLWLCTQDMTLNKENQISAEQVILRRHNQVFFWLVKREKMNHIYQE